MPRRREGVPDDVVRRVAKEVDDVELAPKRVAFGLGEFSFESCAHFAAAFEHGGLRRHPRSLEARERGAVKRLEKLRLPGVPHLGTRRADIGDREEIEGVEPLLRLHDLREGVDHLRVGNVALLRRQAHREVFAHEKAHEVDVFLGKMHGASPGFEALRPDFLVASPEPLSDVVKEPRDEKAPIAVEPRHDVRAEGVFVREVASRKAADVPNDAKRVLIDRVNVKKIVLHLSDDASPDGQEASENAPCVEVL